MPMSAYVRRFALAAAIAGSLAHARDPVTLTHVHGLSYSADGKRLMIPSHHGLAVYSGGNWSKAPGAQHDYMGFSATSKHTYTSGHPAPGSGLVNPLGLLRSRDAGKTWDKLGLEGETDFHLLGAGWNSNALYVWNPAPSSRLREAGLYSTLNDGFAWKRAAAAGLKGEPRSVAVHPDNAAIVAVATSAGVFISTDSGDRFRPVEIGKEGFSVFFDLDGKDLWFGTLDAGPRLSRTPVGGGAPTRIALPALADDAIAYIAQNPSARTEYAIATFQRNVYLSKDAGRNWTPIAERGQGR